jgi:asparagine synthase (glutamine-hydrolysing)
MCGIVGAFGEHDEDVFKAMLESIKHRGPDNSAYITIDPISLGHTRLSIIDLTQFSNQPLWDSTGRACIVFNGEIYNFKVLRKELLALGYHFNSEGDAEVLLNLYLQYGTSCLDKINGIFSFAIWDKEKQTLMLARDNFGVKPLYYIQNEQGFYFASELKSLMKLTNQNLKALNYEAIMRSIIFLWSPGPETILKSVYKLKPGHFLLVKNAKIVMNKAYWQWPKYQPKLRSTLEATQLIDQALSQSVEDQLISDVPLGTFLSGGLDSSLIAAMAKRAGAEDLQCFTIQSLEQSRQQDGFVDDLPYAKQVAQELELPLNIVKIRPDIVRLLPKMIYHMDEPQADIAPLNVMLICEQARKQGIKVLFSGAGGDDIFTGYRRHYAITLEKYWDFLPLFIRSKLQEISRKVPKSNAFFRRISKAFSYAKLQKDERLLSYFYWIDPAVVKNLFVDSIQGTLRENPMDFMLEELKTLKGDKLEKMLYLERKYFLIDHNFNYTDKMSMAHGVEVRVPFLDKRLAEIASTISSKQKQKKRQGKWILKKMAECYLPKSVIYRPKTGFGAPLRDWLKHDLKTWVDDLLSKESLNNRGIFKAEAVHDLILKDRQGKEDYSYPIFALLCIELWCRIFIDGKIQEYGIETSSSRYKKGQHQPSDSALA